MRVMLRVTLDVQAGNRAIAENKLQQLMPQMMEQFKPEAVYFGPDGGRRTAFFFIEVKDSSQIPAITEPFFQELNATVEFIPVMNADDLRKGLADLGKRR
jgi:uncharacterized protein DUF3303